MQVSVYPLKFNIDKKEGKIQILINPRLYSLEIINSAAYSFLDMAYMVFDGDPKKMINIDLYPKTFQNLKILGLKFQEQLINYKNYFGNLKKKGDINKKIIERALFTASPALLEEAEEQEINELLTELEKEDNSEIKEIVKEIKAEK